MARRSFLFTAFGLLGAVVACGDALGPASQLEVYVSATDLVSLDDTVQIVGVVHNGSDVRIEAGDSCAPGIGFLVVDSAGTETDLFAGRAWLCYGRDSHDLKPGETDIVTWAWVPPESGVYLVRSAVRVTNGPTIRSRPAEVRVVERP